MMNAQDSQTKLNANLTIDRLGSRGEGIARSADKRGLVFVPYALAGETVLAEVDGERGTCIEILQASPDRIAAQCKYYTICGGCAVQTLKTTAYLHWKRGLLADALANAHIETVVSPAIDAHGPGRRRVTFHARQTGHHVDDLVARGRIDVGFMRARAHDIIDIDGCPLLAPGLAGTHPAIRAAHTIAKILSVYGKPLDISATATAAGTDMDVRGAGPLDFPLTQKLIAAAEMHDLARIASHGEIIIERRQPRIKIGRSEVILPPGAFLQATEAGETILAALVCAAAQGSARIADLFSGIGTFALRLAEEAEVHAVESQTRALGALARAAHHTSGLKRVTTEARDLFRRPLTREELRRFDCVVFDPPRAGAQAQASTIATSGIPLVIAVSCNPHSFARDARILTEGGYVLESAIPVDQFRYSAHIECVAIFRKPAKNSKKRGILSR